MLLKSHFLKRVTIIGVGFMGGSLGLALKKHSLAQEVVGVSSKQSNLMEAIKVGAIDIAETEVERVIPQSECIILATPVESIVKILTKIGPLIRKGTIVTDIGSSKVDIVEVGEKKLQSGGFFIGSHPLVGSEKSGVENATAELFEKAKCIITPTAQTNPAVKEKVKQLWNRIGCDVVSMTPEEHDTIFAYVSHLPHLLSFGLMETVPKEYLTHAVQSLKDTTRIASSSAQMWNDILISNSRNVIKALDECAKNLSHLRQAIIHKDQKTLIDFFTRVKEKRDSF